jgi:Notch-like protein
MPSCTVNATNNGCRIRTCDNASTDYDTNDKCNTYLSGCITKTGGGCVINTTCTAVGSLEKACVKDVNNNLCVFDTTCKDKTCANAPSTNNTHALC